MESSCQETIVELRDSVSVRITHWLRNNQTEFYDTFRNQEIHIRNTGQDRPQCLQSILIIRLAEFDLLSSDILTDVHRTLPLSYIS